MKKKNWIALLLALVMMFALAACGAKETPSDVPESANALEKIKSEGVLTVTLSPDGKVTFSNRASALSRVEAARLFDRFYTVDSARGSTGLGLSIAKLLTEKLHGTISADYENETLRICIAFPTEKQGGI